jgi:hypothetical protein
MQIKDRVSDRFVSVHILPTRGKSLTLVNELRRHANAYSRDVPMLMADDFNFDLSQVEAVAALAKDSSIRREITSGHDHFTFDLGARSRH